MLVGKLTSSNSVDPSNPKRGKKLVDKNAQSSQQISQQQSIVRQKSAFKVTDSPTPTLLSQSQVNSPDETPGDFKPLKVVIKRVDGGNSSNDESQQPGTKQRKKASSQQQMNNITGGISSIGRKLTNSSSTGGSSPSVTIKSESFDISQFNTDSMMNINESGQQTPT